MATLQNAVVFDLETSFLARGSKRPDALIFELGAVHIPSYKTFHTFVHPFPECDDLFQAITDNLKQNVSSSLGFWHKLLYPKRERRSMTDKELAQDIGTYLDAHKIPSTASVLNTFELWIKETCEDTSTTALVAHNGASFDFRVMDGNAPSPFWQGENNLVYVDSYRHVARRLYTDRRRFGLGPLFKDLVPASFCHHRALDDALATACVLHEMAVTYVQDNHEAFEEETGVAYVPADAYDPTHAVSTHLVVFLLEHLGKHGTRRIPRRRRTARAFEVADEASRKTFHEGIMAGVSSHKTPAQASTTVLPKIKLPPKTPPLVVRKKDDLLTLPNVGKKTQAALHTMNIHTIKDLIERRKSCTSKRGFEKELKGLYRYKVLATTIEHLCAEEKAQGS